MNEYLSKIQNDQKKLGKQLQEIRIKNGLELKDMADPDLIELVEKGWHNNMTVSCLIQHAHDIGCEIVVKDLEEVKSPVQSLFHMFGDICRPE